MIAGDKIDYSKQFTIFTDGSALKNSKNSNAGCAIYFPWQKILLSKSMIGTNNQAELEAVRYALWYFTKKFLKLEIPNKIIYLFTDSEYTIKTVRGEVKTKLNVPKISVIRILIEQIERETGNKVEFVHVKAHTKKNDFVSINNDIVDKEARRKAQELYSSSLTASNSSDVV